MADENGNGKRKRYRPLRYLYLDGKLYRVLHIDRSKDIVTMWSYPDKKRVGLTYSDVKRRMEKAFTVQEVAKMLLRQKVTVLRAIDGGFIDEPQYTYGLSEVGRKHQYMLNEKDIMALHSVLSSRHKGGRPRKDGLITPQKLPSVNELRALIRHEAVLYVKNDDGEFIPTWKAKDF